MTTNDIAPTTLSFNGVAVRDKGEMLSLTDMWKAAGADPSKRPVEWLRGEHAQRFISFMAEDFGMGEVGKSHFGLVQVSKGGPAGGGTTYAHWQIGFAYAKYLSPEFHMWCNTVVRERMEGASRRDAGLPAEVLEMIRRDDGIARMLAHKVTEQGKALAIMTETLNALAAMVRPSAPGVMVTDGVTAGEVCGLSRVTAKYPRGISARVSTRMTQFCAVRKIDVPVTRLGRVRAQVFPTNAAREWLDIEGRGLIKRWVEEKRGQAVLRLVALA